MPIRVQCEKCGSVLKIKEELAGTKGKCPKCKTAFLIPEAGESDAAGQESEAADEASPEEPGKSKATVAAPAREASQNGAEKASTDTDPTMTAIKSPPPATPPQQSGDDFDPAAFLMEGPKPKPVAATPPPMQPPTAKRGGPSKPVRGERLELSDDDDTAAPGPSETTTPPPRGAPRTAADMAGAMLSGAATAASAKDLLARTAQESRIRAGQMPQEQKEARTDYAAFFKELFRSFGVYIAGTLAACVLLYMTFSYMLGESIELPDLAPVSGKVTLGGKPLPDVTVYFMVIGDKTGEYFAENADRPTATPSGITDADGNYELLYLREDGIEGAVIGKNRIYVQPNKIEDYKVVPPQYQQPNTSGLIRDVKPGGSTIDIDL